MMDFHVTQKIKYIYFSLMALCSILVSVYAIIHKISFSPVYNVIFGIFASVLFLSIAIKSFILYKVQQDKRMYILGASFLSGFCFEVFHFINSASVNLQLVYWYFESVSILSGLFLLIIYCKNPIAKDPTKFVRKVNLVYSLFTVAVISILSFNADSVSIMVLSLPLESIHSAFYILFAFIFADMRLNQKQPIFSPFILGVLFLVFSGVLDPSFYYSNSQYRFLLHFLDILGYSFVFVGLNDALLKVDYFSIKEKILLYNGLFISILYFLVIMYSSFVLGFDFRTSFDYMFFAIFLVMIVSFYFLTMKITSPISNIVSGLKRNKPGEKPEILPIISNDEIGNLTSEFNENSKLMYDYAVKENQNMRREQLLRKITENIRSSLDIEETLSFICEETAMLFGVQRVAFAVPSNSQASEEFFIRKEYNLISETAEDEQVVGRFKIANFWGQNPLKNDMVFAIKNIEESNLPGEYKNIYRELGIKSMMGISIKKGGSFWGALILAENQWNRSWTEDEKSLLESIAGQVYIAINQAELYKKAKQTAEREHLLRKITEKIRSSLNSEEILSFICEETSKLFNVQRSTVSIFPTKGNSREFVSKKEYISSPDIEIFTDIQQIMQIAFYWSEKLLDSRSILAIDNILESNTPEYFKNGYSSIGIKSVIGVRIGEEGNIWGILVLSEYLAFRQWSEEEKDLLKAIANQIYIALTQAELYEREKLAAERERISRNVIEILRNSMDKVVIKKLFVKNIGKLFDADRVFFSDYDARSKMYLPVDENSEYLSSADQKSFVGFDWSSPDIQELSRPLLEGREVKIPNFYEYIKQNPYLSEAIESMYVNADVKSSYSFPVLHQDKIIGYFCIQFTQRVCELSTEDINRIRSICIQAGIALYQTDLYDRAQESLNSQRNFIMNVAMRARTVLENIEQLSEEMTKSEKQCENHIRHLNKIDENIILLLNITNNLVENSDNSQSL